MKPAWMIISVCLTLMVITATWWLGGWQTNAPVMSSPESTPMQAPEIDTSPVEEKRAELEAGTEVTTPPVENYAHTITHVPDTRSSRQKLVIPAQAGTS